VHPILFRLGDFPVAAYSVALSLSFAAGIALAFRRAPGAGLAREAVIDVSLWIAAASLLGARLFYVGTHLAEFQPPHGSWLDAVNPFRSGGVQVAGMSVMGGLPAGIGAALVWLRARGLPVLAYADLLAPSVALGAALTRLGCFLNGCCFGTPTSLALGVRFPAGSLPAAAYGEQALHATQLYESAASLALFALLMWLARRRLFSGALFLVLMAGMGLERLAVEPLRFHSDETALVRGVALGLVVLGAAGLARGARRAGIARA
jgi:phosphatidylglycerol:prolipoprotein diacylglycerol transferase